MRTPAVIALLALVSVPLTGCPDRSGGNSVLMNVDADVTYDTSRPDVPEVRGATGDPCAVGAECESGLCTPTASGGVCTETCTDSCPDGFVCGPADASGAESVCWSLEAVACQPCNEDAECQVGGQSGNACVSYGAAGSFCGLACSGEDACPDGFSCTEGQCVKDDGMCACNAAGILAGATTSCTADNDAGSCGGSRRCTPGGLTRCDAPTPEAEVCDGVDQNCDGQTDEGTDGADCSLTNEFGTCTGAVECSAGKPLCVGRVPAAEICNGVDDDCDGETDEDQPDLDLDEIADCVDDDMDGDGADNTDDCAPRNPAIYPGQTEICNGIDDSCNHQVDEGTWGTVEDECGAYVCAGVPGCRTDCTKDAHCIQGYLCDLEDEDEDGNANECLPSVCGNGELEIREVCDDGINDGSYGGCLQGCGGLGPRCGDGLRQTAYESCDDGELNGTPNHCNSTCTGPTPPDCGNGVVEEGEGCDLGDGVNSDMPDAECRTDCSVRRCGDGVVDGEAGEACDAGATENGQTVCGCQEGCQWAPAETLCRGSAGVCDLAETCTGGGSCPADAFDVGAVCHPSTGGCDPAEVCGAAADCPSDALSTVGTVCRASTGGCDPAETCDGETAACPDDALSPAETVCRASAGACDVAETCDGETAACPDDALYDASVICRGPSGGCDVAERCTGDSATCPDDAILAVDTVCRPAQGLCDVAEVCDGATKACPDDAVSPVDTVCNPAQGLCDVAEVCDGETTACPDDQLVAAGEVCRAGDGTCDPAETCDGETAACPDDSYAADETACSAGEGGCTFEPCWCEAGTCTQLCGDGVVQNGGDLVPVDPPQLAAPLLALEACDAGDMNGARDGCSLACDGVCDADYGWVVPAGGTGGEGANAVTTDERGGNVAVGEFFAYGMLPAAPELPGAPVMAPLGAAVFGNEYFFSRNYSRDFWVMAQDTDGAPRWAACGGGSYDDAANGVAHDDLGDIYVTGRFGSSADIDCCENNDPLQIPVACEHTLDATGGSSDYEDVFFAKWSADGELQWAVSAGSWGYDSGEDVATDSVGRSVIVGYHGGNVEVGAQFGDQELLGHGGKDLFVARYDKNGRLAWVRGSGSSFDDAANAVALDGAGNAYVTGYFAATFLWDDDTTEFNADGVEGASLFLLGLDAGGESPWVLTATAANGYSDVVGTDVAVDGAGDVYVTGYFEGGGAVFGDISVATGGYGADLFVAKASGGAWQWVAVASDEGLGSYGGDEIGFGVAVDRAHKVYVTGEFNDHIQFGTVGLDSGCGANCIPMAPALPSGAPSLYGGDGFVAKLSADGQWLWAKRFGGDGVGPTTSRDIGLDPAGRIYTAGGFTGPASFDGLVVDGFNDFVLPAAPGFDSYQDAFVGKMIPDGGARCYACGDGQLDPGESCDDGDGLDPCAGACDGICSGPANTCGDGWDECDEQYDLGGGAADAGMCLLPSGNLWCFQTAENAFTYDPVEPGVAAALGPGLLEEDPLTGLGGNPLQHPDCPACNPEDPNVDCRSGSGRQWGGDGPPLDTSTTARSVCDGDPTTPPCGTNVLGCSDTATNDEAAAVECGDFYELVANTGSEVAFEFDERTGTQGPLAWSLWVSLSGADRTWERVAGGPTTVLPSSDFGDGVPTPMHVVVLTDATVGGIPVANQLDVHFRLYAWGAVSVQAPWAVDNVYVGEPTHSVELGGLVSEWKGDGDATDAVGVNDGAWTTGEAYEASDRCAAFLFGGDASSYVSIGDAATLQLGQVSVSAWFRADDAALTGLQAIATKWNNVSSSQAEYGLFVRDQHPAFGISTAGDAASYTELTGPAVEAGRWYHAVGTYDGDWLRLYVDGVEVAASQTMGGDIQPSGATMEIGAVHEAVDRAAFVGAIDEVMVFSGALDATSVSALYFGQRSLACLPAPPTPTTVWINELHYDNDGADVNEMVEIAGPAGMDVSGWSVALYNGSASQLNVYDTLTLSGTLTEDAATPGMGYMSVTPSSIQNGAPDGLALVDASGVVVQLLSYEGSFTAGSGPASGMTSTDIGVSEPGNEAAGLSLQLVGEGCGYGDFAWQSGVSATPGTANVGQTLGGCP